MTESIWMLETRNRGRKNGKWSDWESMDNRNRSLMGTYRIYPADRIRNDDKYQVRAVEYRRIEPVTL